MTAAIKSSLVNLNEVLSQLEKSATEMESKQKAAPKQPPQGNDLFSMPQNAANNVDAKALASRLDGAIAKVEKLLREGVEANG